MIRCTSGHEEGQRDGDETTVESLLKAKVAMKALRGDRTI